MMTKRTIRLSLLLILTLALLPPLVARATGAQVVQVTSGQAVVTLLLDPQNYVTAGVQGEQIGNGQ